MEARQAYLMAAVHAAAARGAQVETVVGDTAILRYSNPPNHVLHGILSLFTFWLLGGWLWIWLIVSVAARAGRYGMILTVDAWGHVHQQRTSR